MDEARAREILGEWLTVGDEIFSKLNSRNYLHWPVDGGIFVEGFFTIDQLEAIAWWMRNKGVNNES